jgi:ribosomal protein S18 acetylase RimI-like enzyme
MSSREANTDCILSDAWLTGTLGIPSFAVSGSLPADHEAFAYLLEKVSQRQRAFFFAKVPATDLRRLAFLEAAGFGVIDTQVTLEHRGEPLDTLARMEVRTGGVADRTAVADIAGTCFRYSRFHQDPEIDRNAANAIKRQWAQNCIDGLRGSEVLVAIFGGSPAGFLAVRVAEEGAKVVATIDLVGVAVSMQGKGIGSALVQTFISRWRSRAHILRVGTQIANSSSLRLYQRCGFWFHDAAYVLHSHRSDRGMPATRSPRG